MEAESERIQKLLSELAGKDVSEVIAAGKKKLAAMPAAGPAAAGPAAAGGAAPAAKKEEKKVEKEESDQVGRRHFFTGIISFSLLYMAWRMFVVPVQSIHATSPISYHVAHFIAGHGILPVRLNAIDSTLVLT